MANSMQTNAQTVAQGFQQWAQAFLNLAAQAVLLQSQSTAGGVSSVLETWQTSPTNSAGLVSATPDSEVTLTDVITGTPVSGTVPNPGLGFSWTSFNGVAAVMTSFLQLANNGAVTTQPGITNCTNINNGK